MSAFFSGKYNHTLDAKGRVIVPAKFKKNLGDSFMLSLGMDGCLYLFTNERWEEFMEELSNLPASSADVRKMIRVFTANSAELEIDKQGRILIPPELRKKAGLKKEVVFIGVTHKIEVWDKDRYEAAESSDSIDEIVEGLNTYGIKF